MSLGGGCRLRRRPSYFSGLFFLVLCVSHFFSSTPFELGSGDSASPSLRDYATASVSSLVVSSGVTEDHSHFVKPVGRTRRLLPPQHREFSGDSVVRLVTRVRLSFAVPILPLPPSVSDGLFQLSVFFSETTADLRSGLKASKFYHPSPRTVLPAACSNIALHLSSRSEARILSLCSSSRVRYNRLKPTVSNLNLKFIENSGVFHKNYGVPEAVVVVNLSPGQCYRQFGLSKIQVHIRRGATLFIGFVASKHTDQFSFGKITFAGKFTGCLTGLFAGSCFNDNGKKFHFYPCITLTALLHPRGETLVLELGRWAKYIYNRELHCYGPLDPLSQGIFVCVLGWELWCLSKSRKGLKLYGPIEPLLFLDLCSNIMYVSNLWNKTQWVKTQIVRI